MIESPKGPAARPTPGQRTTTPPHTEVVQRQLVQPPGAIMTSGLLASTGAMRRPDRTVTVPAVAPVAARTRRVPWARAVPVRRRWAACLPAPSHQAPNLLAPG